MNWTKEANRTISHRMQIIIWLFGIAVICIIITLGYLQIYTYETYAQWGMRNFTRYEQIPAPRGAILDRHGTPLATNRPIMTLLWHGSEQTPWSAQAYCTLAELENILDIPLIDDPELKVAERRGKTRKIAHDISHETLMQISEQFPANSHLQIATEFQRYYPHGPYASHTIGHINRQGNGVMGIEHICDARLTGSCGHASLSITATGKILSRHEITPSTPGQDVTSTLDTRLQAIAEEALTNQPYNGTIICLDGTAGDITALACRPSFDPNQFLTGIDLPTWDIWQQHRALLNRACNAVYPPASVFKLITSIAALEESCITPHATWYCCGYTHFAQRWYACNKAQGHGSINIAQAIAHSCNIPFYEIGKELSIDTLAYYAHLCGLNTNTGILLSDHTGLIPTHDWKEYTLGERWWQGETLAATIGQSYLLVTPLQIACMVHALCQGYHVRPRVLCHEPIHISRLAISEPTQTFLREALRTVVTDGRAYAMRNLEASYDELIIHAKTGTAQTSHKKRRYRGAQFREHGWFVAHVQYQHYAPTTIVVLLEHSGSSRIAERTAERIIQGYTQICGTQGQ